MSGVSFHSLGAAETLLVMGYLPLRDALQLFQVDKRQYAMLVRCLS
jgi:hypothetical protein